MIIKTGERYQYNNSRSVNGYYYLKLQLLPGYDYSYGIGFGITKVSSP